MTLPKETLLEQSFCEGCKKDFLFNPKDNSVMVVGTIPPLLFLGGVGGGKKLQSKRQFATKPKALTPQSCGQLL